MSSTMQMWRKLEQKPLGTRLFSWAVCRRAPYFSTIRPHITDMRPGRCEVRAANRRRVHNHIGTFHAIAACNLAEVAAGMLMEASLPGTHRWIPMGMNVHYLAKAKTDLRGIAELELPELTEERAEWVVPVRILDAADDAVVTADISMRVSAKKSGGN